MNTSIPQGFGMDPSTTTSSNPRPTSGGGSSGGGIGRNGDGGSTVVVVAGKLSVKIIIVIVVATLVLGGGILFCFFECIAGCCLGIKGFFTGKKQEEGGDTGATAVVEVQPDWVQDQKVEEAGVVSASATTGTGAEAYPVMAEYQPSGYAAPLPPPQLAQDNGLGYLFTGVSPNASQQVALLSPPVTGSPPSPSIPRTRVLASNNFDIGHRRPVILSHTLNRADFHTHMNWQTIIDTSQLLLTVSTTESNTFVTK